MRYSAIDNAKRARIAESLRAVDSAFSFIENSTASAFVMDEATSREKLPEQRARFLEIAQRVQAVKFYGRAQVGITQHPYFGPRIVLQIEVRAIDEAQVMPLICAITDQTPQQIATASAERARQLAEARAEDERETAAATAAREELQKKIAAQREVLAARMQHLTKCDDATRGTLIAVTSRNGAACYKLTRTITKKGFGRYSVRILFCR